MFSIEIPFIGDVRAHIPDGRIDAEKRSVILPKVRFDAAGLKNLLLGIRLQERNLNLTVQKKGISQKISVKAVENIAQIGGGQSPFMGLAGAVASFFEKFPYEKIGIRASLENDVFTVNGTIRDGGTEYLVKRGRFSGVDIINQNPDNRVSFKDMVKRIKRIGAKGGPVVK